MVDVPKNLRHENFRYIPIVDKGIKKPKEKKWTTINNYPFYHQKIREANNFALVCSHGNLVVIDFDDAEFQDLKKAQLPPTFTVKTGGKGLNHYYYRLDKLVPKQKLIFNKKDVGDLQGAGSFIIAPPSRHAETLRPYEIINDIPLANIRFEQLQKIFLESNLSDKVNEKESDSVLNKLQTCFLEEHEDSTPSLAVYDNGTFFCFGCRHYGFIHCIDFRGKLKKHETKSGTFLYVEANEKKEFFGLMGSDEVKEYRMDEAIKHFGNKLDLARQFIKRQPIYFDRSKLWWIWNFNKKCWDIVDETDILNQIDKAVELNTIASKTKIEILEALRRVGRLNQPKEFKNSWVQFRNCIIDVETGREFEPSPEFLGTNPIPWNYGEFEDTPIMDSLFAEWVGEEHVLLLYEILAYCMLPDYPIHRIFCFLGKGSNGKSSYLELVSIFIGKHNTSSTELDTLIENRFETKKLYKKLVCQMGETNFSALRKTSLLKRLSGGDLIGFEFKNKDPFDDYNYAKILISTNNLPQTMDKSHGFYRRWCPIMFPNEFKEAEDILKRIPEQEYHNLTKKCINILKELIVKRAFSMEGTIEERKEIYEQRSNPVHTFIEESCVIREDLDMPFFKFYDAYKSFLEERGYQVQSKSMVGRILRSMKFKIQNKAVSGKTWKYVLGLELEEDFDEERVFSEFENILKTEGNSQKLLLSGDQKILKRGKITDYRNYSKSHLVPYIGSQVEKSVISVIGNLPLVFSFPLNDERINLTEEILSLCKDNEKPVETLITLLMEENPLLKREELLSVVDKLLKNGDLLQTKPGFVLTVGN